MKKSRFLALLLSVLLVATFAVAESADPVVIKAGDATITLSEAQAHFEDLYFQYSDYYASYGMTLTNEEISYVRDEAIDRLVMLCLMENKIAEYGLGEITDEEKQALRVESDANFELGIEEYISYYGMTRDEVMEQLELSGVTADSQFEIYLANIPYQRLYDYVTKGAEVADEMVAEEYALYVESDREAYAEDAGTYEIYTQYYGSEIYYVPEGFRLVKHILLLPPDEISADMIDYETDMTTVDMELSALYEELYALENETEDGEEPRTAEEIQADIDAKQAEYDALSEKYTALGDAILPALQAQIDEIYAKLEEGASFDELIAEYGQDAGMEMNPEGYRVHKDSAIYETNFRDGAVALGEIGSVSEPVQSEFGVHIIQYVGDVPGGPMPITDEIAAMLRESLLQAVQDEMFGQYIEEWTKEFGVESHPELIVLPQGSTMEEEVEALEEDDVANIVEEAVEEAPVG